MNARDLIKAGMLSDARKVLIEEVKASPSDSGKRTLLFQVQSLLGEWDKAERNLDLIASQKQKLETGVQIFKNIVQAERARLEAYKLKSRPSFMPKTPAYSEKYFLACEKLIAQNPGEALEIFEEIEAARPEISGTIDGRSFSGFRDIDTRLSFFLETFAYEKYVLIPFEEIREILIMPPKSLFDLLWITAHITTWDGLSMNCFIPVLYAESSMHTDDRVKLGRITEWVSLGGHFVRGMGQRMFEAGEEDIPLLEIRQMNFTYMVEGGAHEKAG